MGAAISALFLYFALSGLKLADVWRDIQTANYWWLVPGVGAYFIGVWARTWRWHYLLRPIKPIPLKSMWPIVVIGYMGNNVYPFRAGEFIRAYILQKREGISISASIATVLVERIFDGLVMLLFVFIALPIVPGLPNWLKQLVILASLAFFGALIIFLLMAALPQTSRTLYRGVINRFAPPAGRTRLLVIAERFMEGISSLANIKDVFMVFFTSVVIWLLETVKYWFVMYAFSFTVTFFALMLMNGVVNLATTLPSAPGYIGTFDGPGIEVLKVFGVDPVVATAYTLVLHAALWLPITLLGAWYMLRQSFGWQDIDKAVTESKAELSDAPEPNAHSDRPPIAISSDLPSSPEV
ncbi:MAG: lysylphosphatidylglycerol synthase transmembrane domain-containing protein [Anaerolineae bacterium]|nr:lysylphosphatidylglycerol synthase transmembrane domain-containing protein [Anaerolineae bacterium]